MSTHDPRPLRGAAVAVHAARRPLAVIIAATLVAALTSTAIAGGAQAAPSQPPQLPELPAMISAFRLAHPKVGAAEAARRVGQQPQRIAIVDAIAERYPDQFGGSWYDGDTDTLHVHVTTARAADFVASASGPVPTQVHQVRYSLRYLTEQRILLNTGRHPALGAIASGHTGLDIKGNRVVVALSDVDRPAAAAIAGDGPVAITTRKAADPHIGLTACTDRWHCGYPLRSGIGIWKNESAWTNSEYAATCSLGFTATASDGSHWAVTAGHCGPVQASCTAATCWRHGGQYLGALRQRACPQAFIQDLGINCGVYWWADVARIRVSNSYWLQGTWGWLYSTSASAVAVEQAADDDGDLPLNEIICLSAQWSQPNDITCGMLSDVNDPNTYGFARVNGLSACLGDSGGGWYLPNGGQRRALGIQSLAYFPNDGAPGCRWAGYSWFGTLPDINAFWDHTSAATIRVDTR